MSRRFWTFHTWGYASFRMCVGGLITLVGQLLLLLLVRAGTDFPVLSGPFAVIFVIISYPALMATSALGFTSTRGGADSLPPIPILIILNTLVWSMLVLAASLMRVSFRKGE